MFKKCLEVPSKNHEKEILELLALRWKRIEDSDAQYLHDFTNPANRVCITIATILGQMLQRPYLTLLMPSLLTIEPSAYITCNYTEPLNLRELIISDCNQRLISLPDVLDFAQEDALLKHNSLFEGKQKCLTVTEKERFLSRHPNIRSCYEALNARMAFKYHGDTVGAALKRLIEGLRAGGRKVLGFNHEYDSGKNANESIFEFNQYLETLDDEVKTTLMSAKKFDRYDVDQNPKWLSIDSLWNRLARTNDSDYQDAIYCVEIVAARFEEVLNENPGLYDLLSYQGSASQNMATLNEQVEHARVAVNDALASLQTHRSYGIAGDKKLCSKLLTHIERHHHRDFDFSKDDFIFLIRQYNIDFGQKEHGVNKAIIARTLMEMALEFKYQPRFIMSILSNFSDEEQQPFLKLTEFNPKPYRFRPLSRHSFLALSELRKRNTECLEEEVVASP